MALESFTGVLQAPGRIVLLEKASQNSKLDPESTCETKLVFYFFEFCFVFTAETDWNENYQQLPHKLYTNSV